MFQLICNDSSDIGSFTKQVELAEALVAAHEDKIRTQSYDFNDFVRMVTAFKGATEFNRRLLDSLTFIEK